MMMMNKDDREKSHGYIAEWRKNLDEGLSPHWVLIEACRFAEGWELGAALPYVLDIEDMFEKGHLVEPEDAFYKAKTLLVFCEISLKDEYHNPPEES